MDNTDNKTLKTDNQSDFPAKNKKVPIVTNYSKKANKTIIKNLIAFLLLIVAIVALYPLYSEWGIPYHIPCVKISTKIETYNEESYNHRDSFDGYWGIARPVIGEDLIPLCRTKYDNDTRIIYCSYTQQGMDNNVQLDRLFEGRIIVDAASDESITIKTDLEPYNNQPYFKEGNYNKITLRTGESVELVATSWDANITIDELVVSYNLEQGKLTVGDFVRKYESKILKKWEEFKYKSPFF